MDNEVILKLLDQGVTVAVLCVGGYFMIKYFMESLKFKDSQNQENLNRFIGLVEKTNIIFDRFNTELLTHGSKLHDMHEDIKIIKNIRHNGNQSK